MGQGQPGGRRGALRRPSREGRAHLEDHELYVVDAFRRRRSRAPARLRVITDSPWHALFAKTLFIEPTDEELATHEPDALVLHAPAVEADPEADGTHSATFVVLHPGRGEVLIGGTYYAGEIKKSIFSAAQRPAAAAGRPADALLGQRRRRRRVALFFGLSGTGKTTLSADPERHADRRRRARLVRRRRLQLRGRLLRQGDQPLGRGRAADLPHDAYASAPCSRTSSSTSAGALDLDRRLEDREHARGLPARADRRTPCRRSAPAIRSNVVFLTADAFGVLPPIARLSRDQALFYFLSGFTAKLAGTEIGVDEPQPTFSRLLRRARSCRRRRRSMRAMLGEKLQEHGARVWLVNTGWTGGPSAKAGACRSRRRARSCARR